MTKYKVTRFFTGGILKGATYTENTTVKFEVGFESKPPNFGSPFRIIAVEVVE